MSSVLDLLAYPLPYGSASAAPVCPRTASILLVEDDPDVRRLVRGRLVAAGHLVTEAGTAEQAITFQRGHRVDLVITDLMLPGMSGEWLIGELRCSAPTVPVIAISGAPGADVSALLHRAAAQGAVGTLRKPFTTPQLLGAVEEALT